MNTNRTLPRGKAQTRNHHQSDAKAHEVPDALKVDEYGQSICDIGSTTLIESSETVIFVIHKDDTNRNMALLLKREIHATIEKWHKRGLI